MMSTTVGRTLLDTLGLVAATVSTALLAGTYFAFSVAVAPALARTDARAAVATMQQINVVIVNPWFMLAFLGSPVLVGLALVGQVRGGGMGGATLALATALALVLVSLVVTVVANLPLNDALAAATTDPAAALDAYLRPWVRWNLVRTLTTAAASAALAVAALSGR